MPLLLFLLCIFITITSPHAHAATRLGLHVTTEEKAVWNARRTDTVGNIGGVTYKTMWDTRILPDANTFKAQAHPGGDGLWDGWTAAGCFPNGQRDTSFRPNGTKMMKSAFVFLVTGDTTYAAGVASNLLAQIAKTGTDWTNAGKWCTNITDTVTMIDYLPWLTRLLYAYDYLIAGGYTGFTAANKTAIQTWFVNAALYWEHVVTTTVEKRYSTARATPPSYAVCDGVACPGGDISPTHWNSTNIARSFSTAWHNPTSLTASLMGSVGVLANHAGLKNSATLFYKEFLRFSTWADGSIHDQSRWDDVPNVSNGVIRAWSHIYMQLQPMILLADHFARKDDASLYAYKSPGGQFGTGGGNVDLLTVVRWFSRMENNTLTPKVYGANTAGAVGEATRLQSKAEGFNREPVHIGNAMANIRFKNAEIETSYSGVLGADSGCGGFGGCSSGAWGLIPDMLFMFGNQETMEPYTTASVKLAINATDVEVAQWNIRRVSGPYKAEWDDLKANADAFKASPTARYQGNTTNPAACYGTAGVTSPSRSQDEGLRDAAFVYFVTGDTTFLTAAKNALIAQAAVAGTKFENTTKWCTDANATITGLGNTVGSWLRKLAYAYGWIRSALTVTERSTLDTWFTNAGVYYYTGLDLTAVRRFPNRLADNYDLGNPPDAGSERGPLYIGGPLAYSVQGAWENDPMATNATMAVIGVILNNVTMKDRAARYVKEWLKFNVYANGAIMDQSRWGWGATSGTPQHGYLYSGQTIGSVLTTADVLLRDNYTNLFTYSTSDGMHGTAGGPKTILTAMQHFAGLTNGTIIERANIAGLTDAERIIDQTGTEQNRIEFINLAQGNLYYKDAASITAYTKPIPGTYDNVGCEALNGDWCTLPAVRFMYAGLEGISDPYVPTTCTHYAAHNGLESNSGTTETSPYRVVDFWGKAHAIPGKVLCLLNGTYTGANSMIQTPTTFVGTTSQPITIRALNDGEVLIDGQDSLRPVDLQGSWGILEGINATRGNNANVSMRGDDWVARRIGTWDGGVGESHLIEMGGNRNTVEDFFAFGTAEKVFASGSTAKRATGNIARRGWVRGGDTGDALTQTEMFEVGYGQDNVIAENILVTVQKVGPEPGPSNDAHMNFFRTQNSKLFGSISYVMANAQMGRASWLSNQGTDGGSDQAAGDYHPTTGLRMKDVVAIIQPGHPRFNSTTAFVFHYSQPGPHGSDNQVDNIVGVAGSPPSISTLDYTVTNGKFGTTIAAAIGAGKSIFQEVPGICKRYVNGTLTTQGLWPWPMNQRIINGLIQANQQSVDITATMESLLGTIPEECKSGATIINPPIVVINVPSSAADYSSHIPVTTVSGTVTGANIASVVWHCNNCVVTDGTATFTPPSTFAVNGLQTNLGANTVTITATNSSGLVGTDQITITLTTPGPDPTTGMIYRLAFEEGMGSSVIDSTGTQGPTSLTGGFSWQPGLFGAYAVQFDGTGIGTLPGLLGGPASVTIQGHVQLTGPGDIEGGTLLNIGNYVGVRVYPGRIRAFYNVAGGTYSGLDFFTTIGAGWNHVAYTHNSTERKLYLNGFLVASASSSPLVWTGQGANTTIARHAQGLTTYDLQGKLDDVRVYNRALSQADIQASIVGVPSPPLITITSPSATGTFATNSSTVSLSGSVSDNVAVASVTVSCPQCNPALVDSAATVSGSTWSKNSIVLGTAPSTNVLTVKATDNEGAQALTQLTVTYTIVTPPTDVPACTRWASNNGSGNGLTFDTPYTIAAFLAAHSQSPGAVLCLKDGMYTGGNNLVRTAATFAGTSSNPIWIRAINEGKVVLDGQDSIRPVDLQGSWGVLSGVDVKRGDNANLKFRGSNWLARKIVSYSGGVGNTHLIAGQGTNNTAEDIAVFGTAEKLSAFGSSGGSGNKIRRLWAMVTDNGDATGGVNAVEQGYGQDGVTYENALVTWNMLGSTGQPTGILRSFSTFDSRVYGSIVYLKVGYSFSGANEMFSAHTEGGSPHLPPAEGGSCTYHTSKNNIYNQIVSFVQPGHASFGNYRPFTFNQSAAKAPCPPLGPGSNNKADILLGVGAANQTPSIHSTSYTVTNARHGTTLANALSGSGHSSIFTLMPLLCKKSVNGVASTEGLWPWPMNQRIKDAIVAANISGLSPVDVTADIEAMFGAIPEACKSSEVIEPPPPVATSLTLISQPTATNICPESGSVFQVSVLDQFGAPIGVSGLNVTLNISTNPSQAELVGTITVPTVSGIATFNNWCISLPGEGYKITALASGVTGITSSPFTVTEEAVGDRLMFIGTITGVPLYSTITPPITVHVINEDGLVDTTSTATITLSIYEPVGKEELTGTLVKDAVAGVAVFNNVAIAGTIRSGYAIKATSPGLAQGSTGVTVVSRIAMDQPMGSLSSTPLFILNRSR